MAQYLIQALLLLVGVLVVVFVSASALSLLRGKERKAAFRAFMLGLILSAPFFAGLFLPVPGLFVAAAFLLAGITGFVLLCVFPAKTPQSAPFEDFPRYDERGTMFARMKLAPSSPEYGQYYDENPHLKKADDALRGTPAYLRDREDPAYRMSAASRRVLFSLAHGYQEKADLPPVGTPISLSPETAASFIKGWLRSMGAASVGIAPLRACHVYSHRGFAYSKGEMLPWGEPIENNHAFAIVISVEMKHELLATAPGMAASMEMGNEYVRAAVLAISAAQWIRELGWEARAHVLGNYQVKLPPLAQDAGLGEIGRMGLLITPEQGARVRLAAVTTDLPLLVEGPASFNLVEFCKQCTKCAEACPAGAISKKDLAPGQSAAAWKIDAQACYAFFQKSGVLCGRCLTVCPHSHPNSWPHQAARWFARRTRFARRCLLLLDDYLYGKAPSRMAEPRWLPDSSRPQ